MILLTISLLIAWYYLVSSGLRRSSFLTASLVRFFFEKRNASSENILIISKIFFPLVSLILFYFLSFNISQKENLIIILNLFIALTILEVLLMYSMSGLIKIESFFGFVGFVISKIQFIIFLVLFIEHFKSDMSLKYTSIEFYLLIFYFTYQSIMMIYYQRFINCLSSKTTIKNFENYYIGVSSLGLIVLFFPLNNLAQTISSYYAFDLNFFNIAMVVLAPFVILAYKVVFRLWDKLAIGYLGEHKITKNLNFNALFLFVYIVSSGLV